MNKPADRKRRQPDIACWRTRPNAIGFGKFVCVPPSSWSAVPRNSAHARCAPLTVRRAGSMGSPRGSAVPPLWARLSGIDPSPTRPNPRLHPYTHHKRAIFIVESYPS
jgi:hypothetical protein